MFIKATDLIESIGFVNSLAVMDKNPPGVLFNIKNDSIGIIYNVPSRAIIHTIDATVEDDEVHGNVTFDFTRLNSVLSTAKSSGNIKTDDIELKLSKRIDGSGLAVMNITKYIEIVKSNEDDSEEEIEKSVVSENTYELSWHDDSNMSEKQKILLKPACSNMFDDETSEVVSKSDVIELFNGVTVGDAKIAYVSKVFNGAFAANTNSLTFVRAKHTPGQVIQLSVNVINAVVSILNSVDSDEVAICSIPSASGELFAHLFFTPDHKTSIYVMASPKQNASMQSMARYGKIEYNDYQANVMSEAIQDVMKSVVSINSSASGTLKFFRNSEDGNVYLEIDAENSGASVNNTYRVRCGKFTYGNGDVDSLDNNDLFHFSVNLKMLSEILNYSKKKNIAIDVNSTIGESGKVMNHIRIGFFDRSDMIDVIKSYKSEQAEKLGLDESSIEIDSDTKNELHKIGLSTCIYFTASNK